MKNLCLFDLDGTLTDPKMGITKSVDHALNTFGIQTENLDDLQKFIGPPLWDSFRDYYHFTDAQAQEAVCQYREYFVVRGIFENTLYDGILVMLNLLSEKGIHMAIATSKPTVYTERIAEYFGLSRYFKAIVGSELDGTRSKKGEVIAYALQLLNADRKKKLL